MISHDRAPTYAAIRLSFAAPILSYCAEINRFSMPRS
jgi:hypothetical protein